MSPGKRDLPDIPDISRLNAKFNASLKEIKAELEEQKGFPGKLLWRGSWSGGSISVRGSGNYTAFMLDCGGEMLLVTKRSEGVLAGGGVSFRGGGGLVVSAFYGNYINERFEYSGERRLILSPNAPVSAEASSDGVRAIYGLW